MDDANQLIDGLNTILERAKAGDDNCKQTREIIRILVSLTLDPRAKPLFPSDYGRILKKQSPVKYTKQVQQGFILYDKMSAMRFLVQPVGSRSRFGPACAIRLRDLRRMAIRDLLKEPGLGSLVFREGFERSTQANWCAFDLLSPAEKQLFRELEKKGKYFGGRRRPTLQSVAAKILSKDDDKFEIGRNVRNYIKAIQEAKPEHRNFSPTPSAWYRVNTVDRFGTESMSIRDLRADLLVALRESVAGVALDSFQETWPLIQKNARDLYPAITNIMQALHSIAASTWREDIKGR